jgi:dihydroorotase
MRLLKKVKLYDSHSTYHQKVIDILIQDGIIRALGPGLTQPEAEVFEQEGLCVSIGWMDVGVFAGEPGYEYREDLQSLTAAAAAGGFTEIACLPNTNPPLDNKSSLSYIQNASKSLPVLVHPLGAISEGCKGKDLTELLDMEQAGAVAFTDGLKPVQDNGLMLRALQYIKGVDGLIMNTPFDESLSHNGLMHEGTVSTSLGMKGLSRVCETMMLQRDIWLSSYTESRLHVQGVSSAASVDLIREAKKAGLKVTASVPVMNLCFDHEALEGFDENFKVLPPLRGQEDQKALWDGLRDGTLDSICSNHLPWDTEAKLCEFPYSEFGASTLEIAFSMLMTFKTGAIPLSQLIDLLSLAPRRILRTEVPTLAEGRPANLTLFHPGKKWTFQGEDASSKGINTPLQGKELQGKVIGTIHKHHETGLEERKA